jgi:hypothetical protein
MTETPHESKATDEAKPTDETIPIPRYRIFVLNANFVVQWEENRVQDLQSGRYYAYTTHAETTPITDFELSELRKVGIVEDYDDLLVHLSPLPNIVDVPVRYYYVNTAQHKDLCHLIEDRLRECGLLSEFSVRTQERFVIVRAADGHGFISFDAAERARQTLMQQLPDLMQTAVVAFTEILNLRDAL